MYVPQHFALTDHEELVRLMRAHPFATLVTIDEGGAPFASHIPFVVDDEPFTLLGHVARANPQWRSLERDPLVIFHGPHAYVSPSWYAHGAPEARVPTWNYVAVHAVGRARLLDDVEATRLLERLVEAYEAHRPSPWTVDMSNPQRQAMLRGIVGFAIEVTRVEGKIKLSQNRVPGDRERVRAQLAEGTTPDELELAALMAKLSR